MGTCHDPYEELEIYLERAQEEIGKAFEELLQCEKESAPSSGAETVLPPPPAFRSSQLLYCQPLGQTREKLDHCSLGRVRHDEDVPDLRAKAYSRGSRYPFILQKSFSCPPPEPYFSSRKQFRHPEKCLDDGSATNGDRHATKKLRSSQSFPEGAIDTFLREQVLPGFSSYRNAESALWCAECHRIACDISRSTRDEQANSENRLPRLQKQFSFTAKEVDASNEHSAFPRPPSGDMNLLSIWADNFVLAVDKTLSEVDDSIPSSSPSSGCSPRSNKWEEKDDLKLNPVQNSYEPAPRVYEVTSNDDSLIKPSQVKCPNHGFKLMTSSPDSGISQVYCDTTDEVDFAKPHESTSCEPGLSLKLKIDLIRNSEEFDVIHCITPPPPEFEDPKEAKFQPNYYGSESNKIISGSKTTKTVDGPNKKDAKVQARGISRAASNVVVLPDHAAEAQDIVHGQKRAVHIPRGDVVDHATMTAVCAICEVLPHTSCTKAHTHKRSIAPTLAEVSDKLAIISALSASQTADSDEQVGDPSHGKDKSANSSTLPKSTTRMVENERFTCSLPRDAGRSSADMPQLRKMSASSSAVSSLSQVSVDELAAFMRKVKTSTYHPPPRADVCVDAKDDGSFSPDDLNRDAVTQTTPVVPLSRSSSFTWVTECDCSDWDSLITRSTSEDSLLAFSRSASDPEKAVAPGSTSPSSTTDDDGLDMPQNSGGSSLYLSACSEASDSHVSDSSQDDGVKQPDLALLAEPLTSTELVKKAENNAEELGSVATAAGSVKSSSSAGTLVDFGETSPTCETVSLDSSSGRSLASDHPASFPSTLKSGNSIRVSDDSVYRRYPIEANVLVVNELNAKSVSAPVLLRQKRQPLPKFESAANGPTTNSTVPKERSPFAPKVQPPSTISTTKEWNELQAFEACTWLRAAGFPQYAQMYEDNQFPIDIPTVQKDHSFLSPDSFQSLFRRLNTLNRCAQMKQTENVLKKSFRLDDSDDEEDCALSENWQYQRNSKRWSRVPSPTEISNECSNYINEHSSLKPPLHKTAIPIKNYITPEEAYCSSYDSVFLEEHQSSPDTNRKCMIRNGELCPSVLALREGRHSPGSSSGSGGTLSAASEEMFEKKLNTPKIQRSGSDRIKEGAKALLRRMESLKGKRKKKASNHTTESTSSADGNSYRSLSPSPQFNRVGRLHFTCTTDLPHSETPNLDDRKKTLDVSYMQAESSAHSDSECQSHSTSELWQDSLETTLQKPFLAADTDLATNQSNDCSNHHGIKNKVKGRNANIFKSRMQKKSIHFTRSNPANSKQGTKFSPCHNQHAPLAVFNTAYVESLDKDLPGKSSYNSEQGNGESNEGEIIIVSNERRDSGVGASLTRATSQCYAPWHSFPEQKSTSATWPTTISISELSAPQMLLLRKLSLLKLTTLIEKFLPTSRTGWSWILPKLFRRNRTPDYKDKIVFGLPLVNMLQRTGNPLPSSIELAINHLRKTALDSSGLFRKSGVRSRIQRLRNIIESNPDNVDYEDQQPYDVADMIKQYFRELPEALLTNKLSDIFISIFQYIPEQLRLEAVQSTILLMPDENREVLHTLLSFLYEVCEHSGENQMTATNIAVCFAPSLFQRATPRSASASPRRRKTVGAPDLKELNDNRAAYECLASMVINYKYVNSVILDSYSQSRLSCLNTGLPATLLQLPDLISEDAHGWQAYTYGCVQSLLKEAKDKYKNWSSVIQSNGVELCYKKMNDSHTLRLWKVSTEVEAPPTELLNRILRERHIWDPSFIKWRVVQTLDRQTEIFQFVCTSTPPHPPCSYCTIRSWRTELSKGACALVEASINHPEAELLVDGVRGIVLASRYLIEPCGSGKSRVAHLCRIDIKGRSPDWYNRAYGHICALNLKKLRDSFSHGHAEGRETKV